MEETEKDRNIRILHSGVFTPLRRWATKWSLWPCHFLTSCCGVELAHTGACGYDMERLGTLNMGISRQANFIMVEGTITRKMARALRIVWEQMPDPKFVNVIRSEEHTSELQSTCNLVCRLLLEKQKKTKKR